MLDFGLTEKTGVDTTGEASGFVNSEIKYSTLALACYAFGQNFNVTPIALLAAQCACVNGGPSGASSPAGRPRARSTRRKR